MTDLVTSINLALAKQKSDLIKKIEEDFFYYLKMNNQDFDVNPNLNDLEFLFRLYDNVYFSGNLGKNLNLSFKFSNKLTRSAGNVKYSKRKSEAKIAFSYPLIFKSYLKKPEGYTVNGAFCKNPVEALMRVLEHELTHLVEFVLYGVSNCNDPQFLKMAYELFGHTKNKHLLGLEIKNGVEVNKFKKGDRVSFPYYGKIFKGNIISINKNTTIEVAGLYYTKRYYVPLDLLVKINPEDELE